MLMYLYLSSLFAEDFFFYCNLIKHYLRLEKLWNLESCWFL